MKNVNTERYYVYEWYNIKDQEVFYVGKGTKNRYSQRTGRNQFFIDYYNTHICESRIVYYSLTEKEAYDKEIELIDYYRKIVISDLQMSVMVEKEILLRVES